MKLLKNMLWVSLLTLSESVCAQMNPVEGYIISNEGDTINGTLDYLSPAKNSKECHFQKEGESEFKIYKPNEIKGYRIKSDGVYYVSRTFPVDNVPTTFFAEYLLKGGVSLYRLDLGRNVDYYFFENEKGEVVQMKSHTGNLEADLNNEGKNITPAFYIFSKSTKVRDELRKSDLSAQDLTRITREYNETYCQESGDCVQFQYDEEKTLSCNLHFMASIGAGMMMLEGLPENIVGYGPNTGVGMYVTFPRLSNRMSFESRIDYAYYSSSDAYSPKWTSFSFTPVMVNYFFCKEHSVTPYISFGITFGYSAFTSDKYDLTSEDNRARLYPSIGLGTNIRSGSHIIRLGLYGSYNKGMIDGNDATVRFAASFII